MLRPNRIQDFLPSLLTCRHQEPDSPTMLVLTAEAIAPPLRQYKRRLVALSARMRPRRSLLVASHTSPSFPVRHARDCSKSCVTCCSRVFRPKATCYLSCATVKCGSYAQHIRIYPSTVCTAQSILPNCGQASTSTALVGPANRSRQRCPGFVCSHVNRQVVPVADAANESK